MMGMATRIGQVALAAAAAAALAACGDTKVLDDAVIDYKSPQSQASNPLSLPPDLISSLEPEAVAETYSRYLISSLPERQDVAPQVADARYVKDGNFRWVLVELPPDEVWPVLVQFWEDIGFTLVTQSTTAGIMETNWLQNRSKLIGIGLTGVVDEFLGRLQDTGERDKFRTRIEQGDRPGTTEIYISHRGVQERFVNGTYEFERIPNDASLEVELLRRIMLRFRDDAGRVEEEIVEAESDVAPVRYGEDWLLIDSEPDTAWRRLSIALDRSGFTVAERSREDLFFVIRYSDERVEDRDDQGFFGGLFSTDSAIAPVSILISLEPDEGGARMSVRPHEGSQVREIAPDIIALISEHI